MDHSTKDLVAGDELMLAIGPGQAGMDEVQLRAPRAAMRELALLIEDEGIRGGPVAMMSIANEIAVVAISVAGGFGGLGTILNAYFGRHRHRSIRVVCGKGGESVQISGCGEAETARILEEVLTKVIEHKESNDQWLRDYMADGHPNPYEIQVPPRPEKKVGAGSSSGHSEADV